ncbi:MAG: acetyl/propionyl/methylcrotonyl-CoA carboxylase subunit alpha [Rhodomicrobium sp.]
MIAKPFQKILIANRGEIACRIARTAKTLGYRTAAIFSDADANALHVRMADEAIRIGPPAPHESYLKIEAILSAAQRTGAGAIHPGYGFLAENASFAEACESAGLVFIGPPSRVIRAIGDKAAAKSMMLAAGVPCVPGYAGEDQSDAAFAAEAEKLGFPLLIKSVGGGGGRGIRAVHAREELLEQLAAARREAKSAFANDRVMLERLIERSRHIEVQVFGDIHGNMVHLYERDCTSQRRRQKIIEEAPSPVLTAAQREKLTGYALAAARAAGYVNAGTVEFITDPDLNIYFLEMNTRLQVEHPVTEMVTSLDLVEWQLRVAAGERLPLRQDEIALQGHAIEARLCAEDPYDSFKPQTGRVLYWRPRAAESVRIDSGVEEGSEVTPFYDSMLAKVITHSPAREQAVRRLACSLEDTPLLGIASNLHFLVQLLRSEEFVQARLTADTLDGWMEKANPLFERPTPSAEIWALAVGLFTGLSGNDWFQSGSAMDFVIDLRCGGDRKSLHYRRLPDGSIATGEARVSLVNVNWPEITYEAGGIRRRAIAIWEGTNLHLSTGELSFTFSENTGTQPDEIRSDERKITAPAAGLVVRVLVELAQTVAAGETLAVIDAMKMETRVRAVNAGRIFAVHVKEGEQVANASLLFEIQPLHEPANV